MNQALNDFVYYSKYAKYDSKLKRKETYSETIDRVFNMHISHLEKNYPEALKNAEFSNMFMETWDYAKKGIVYGSQRALQFGGEAILKNNAKLYNCSFSYCDRWEFFGELLWILLCGCGVGASVHTNHVNKLGVIKQPLKKSKEYIIDDSIEGWGNAIHELMKSYFFGSEKQIFNYSSIRPKGSSISSGFLAPGPDGLRKAIENITKILDSAIERKLTTIECFSINCHLADSVLSGGIRRSALGTLFDPKDDLMRNAKISDWYKSNPHFARSNNSMLLVRDDCEYEIFANNFEQTKQFGEPGFAFVDNNDIGFNPCFEISFKPINKDGKTGWLFCNLTTISGKNINFKEEFYLACKYASFLGTLQASYTKFSYLGEITENLIKDESLIGVSISGIMTNIDIFLNAEILKKGADVVKKTNKQIAEILGINIAKRCTNVKPDGNFSSMTGNSPGCHPAHSKRYIRRAQCNKEEEAGKIYAKYNPHAITESVWSSNKTDNVISFAIEQKDGTIFKKDLTAIQHLEYVKLIQENWVNEGNNFPEEKINNNVSVTALVGDNEWNLVRDYLWENKNVFSGISLLPKGGDLIYNQAAYSEVLLPEEMLQTYGNGIIFASGLIVDILNVFGDLWNCCSTIEGIGEKIYTTEKDVDDFLINSGVLLPDNYNELSYKKVEKLKKECKESLNNLLIKLHYPQEVINYLLSFKDFDNVNIFKDEIRRYLDNELFNTINNLSAKRDIVRRVYKFSKKYFNNNIPLTLNALKHVQLYHDWCKLVDNYKPINWKEITWNHIENINIDTLAAGSCSGGACEIL